MLMTLRRRRPGIAAMLAVVLVAGVGGFAVWGGAVHPRLPWRLLRRRRPAAAGVRRRPTLPGRPTTLVLAPHQELVVAFGTAAQLPSPIPSAYQFPPGL